MIAQTESNIAEHFLYPSSIFAERKATNVQTVLGSCVSVCLFDQRKCFGGINHYMLPVWKGEGLATPKYGNIAIEKLIERMLLLGAERKHLIAKIFGGAEQLEENSVYNIGKQNIQVAEDTLIDCRIPIKAASVGGKQGRKILFHSGSGFIYMRYV